MQFDSYLKKQKQTTNKGPFYLPKQSTGCNEIRQIDKVPAFLNRHKPKEVVNGSSHKKLKINPGQMHRGKP